MCKQSPGAYKTCHHISLQYISAYLLVLHLYLLPGFNSWKMTSTYLYPYMVNVLSVCNFYIIYCIFYITFLQKTWTINSSNCWRINDQMFPPKCNCKRILLKIQVHICEIYFWVSTQKTNHPHWWLCSTAQNEPAALFSRKNLENETVLLPFNFLHWRLFFCRQQS